jgi:tetratricopeptide (TPR) repeat protein
MDHFQRFTPDDPAELGRQIDSARSEIEALRQAGDHAGALESVASLGSLLTTARREGEARSLLLEAVASARAAEESETLGWLLLSLATANQYLELRAEAQDQFRQALAIARSLGVERLEHFTLHHLGRFLVEQHDVPQARLCFSQALALRERLDDPRQASSRRALAALADSP